MMTADHAATAPPITDFERLPRDRLQFMLSAGDEVLECLRVLHKGNLNLVAECLRGQGTFYEYNHYPDGDVFDRDTHAQYYYHTHPGREGEHGHFHTFLRPKGMPSGVAPVPYEGKEQWPSDDDALSHIIAISMDTHGMPIALFATNRWVTNEAWYPASDVIRMLDWFQIDHAYPSWPVNRWLTAMMKLFRPQIEALLQQRDAVVQEWSKRYPKADVFEDRALDMTGIVAINIDRQIRLIEQALGETE